MVPLADGESRHDLVQTLVRLHQDDEAARQRQWVLRAGGDARSVDRPGPDGNRRCRRREGRRRQHGDRLAAGRRGTAQRQRVPDRDAILLAAARRLPTALGHASCSARARRPRRSRNCTRPRRFSPPTFNWPWIAMPSCESTARRARPTPSIGGCWSGTRRSAAISPAAAPTTTISPGWRPISIAISTRPWPMPSGRSNSNPNRPAFSTRWPKSISAAAIGPRPCGWPSAAWRWNRTASTIRSSLPASKRSQSRAEIARSSSDNVVQASSVSR